MKNIKLAALAIALVGTFGAGNALAADTATLDVTANVVAACQFKTGGLLEFGTLDSLTPTDTGPVAATTNPTFKCTKGAVYTITDNSAAKPLSNGTDTIVYTLAYTPPAADGTIQTLAITGSILATAYDGVSAGAYAATVTLSINP